MEQVAVSFPPEELAVQVDTLDVEILELDGRCRAYRLSRGRHLRVLPS